MKKRELKEGTYCYYKYDLQKHVIPHIGGLKLQQLRPEHIDALYTTLLREISPSTVHMIHAMLSSALDLAVRWKKLASNPCRSVNAPRRANRPSGSWRRRTSTGYWRPYFPSPWRWARARASCSPWSGAILTLTEKLLRLARRSPITTLTERRKSTA